MFNESMHAFLQSRGAAIRRRDLFRNASLLSLSGVISHLRAEESITLPFANGQRPLVRYPQKRPLIRLTSRPPQLETPFSVFNESVLTPNDAFFVRYHLPNIPMEIDSESFRLEIKGSVQNALKLSIKDLKDNFSPAEIVAVNQCSGNSRGFSNPRVSGGQLGNGAMGNARWRGVRLKDVLEKAGVSANAKQVSFNGMDTPPGPQVPDFIKALEIDHAMSADVLLAYSMNGEDLPLLNGYPLRLVVPGYYGTYWVKHVHEITVLDSVFEGFWMSTAYRIPNTPGACIPSGTAAKSTLPIGRLNVRSFLTSHLEGGSIQIHRETVLRGIAFDGGAGINEVVVSMDGGNVWRKAVLGEDLGNYSFREWTLPVTPQVKGPLEIRVKATNRLGESQPMDALWNPAGYMRNVVEAVKIEVIA